MPLDTDDAGSASGAADGTEAYYVNSYKSWLMLGIEELGRDLATEVESEWMVPLLVEEEMDRLMAWQLGVSL